MDLAGLSQFLLASGPWGAVVLYLLWERRDLQDRLHKCQEGRMDDIRTISAEMKAAFATSTEVLRANNLIQDKAAASALQIAEAMRLHVSRLEHVEEFIERLEKALP